MNRDFRLLYSRVHGAWRRKEVRLLAWQPWFNRSTPYAEWRWIHKFRLKRES